MQRTGQADIRITRLFLRNEGRSMKTVIAILVLALLCASRTIASTYHVFPDGSGSFPSIQAALDACTDGDEVILGNGVFTGPANTNLHIVGKVITVRSEAGPANCVIDCQRAGRAFVLDAGFVGASIVGITMRNGNASGIEPDKGGAIYCSQGYLLLKGSRLENNSAFLAGGGLYVVNAFADVLGCRVEGNIGGIGGGADIGTLGDGIRVGDIVARPKPPRTDPTPPGSGGVRGKRMSQAGAKAGLAPVDLARVARVLGLSEQPQGSSLRDCLFAGNLATQKYREFHVTVEPAAIMTISNSIMWPDTTSAQLELTGGITCQVDHSDIFGGSAGIAVESGSTLNWGVGNIDLDPQFLDADGPDDDPATWEDNDLHLTRQSPCIDAGDPAFVALPGETDLDGSLRVCDGNGDGSAVVDMGAYETQSFVGVPGAGLTQLRLWQNEPNPFNPRTTIRFYVPTAGPVHLAVYDVAGRLVRVLVAGERPAGSQEAVWDGRDASGRSAPSGSYLARLEAGGEVEGVRLSLVR
jgi:hypothetical protein